MEVRLEHPPVDVHSLAYLSCITCTLYVGVYPHVAKLEEPKVRTESTLVCGVGRVYGDQFLMRQA